MEEIMEKRYAISSVGNFYKKSLEMFAEKLVDENGKEIDAEEMELGDWAYAIFSSGTGKTKTSVRRIE
jgi:hypothetical protein